MDTENGPQKGQENTTQKAPALFSWIFVITGLVIILFSLDILPLHEDGLNAPRWVLSLCGLIFFIAGLMMFVGRASAYNDLLAAFLFLAFALISGWAAFWGDGSDYSGGLPFVGKSINVLLGRVVFGTVSASCFIGSLFIFRSFNRKRMNAGSAVGESPDEKE